MSALKADDKGVITACPACGQNNRIPFARLGEAGQCGKCKAALPPPGGAIELLTDGAFANLLAGSPLPVVVDYWAPWCGPCRMVAPEMEKVAASGRGKFVVAKVNTEELQRTALQYSISAIPTMAVFIRGREVGRTSGARPAAAIEAFVRDAAAKAAV